VVAAAHESQVDLSAGVVEVLGAVVSDQWSVVSNNRGLKLQFTLEIDEWMDCAANDDFAKA